MGRGRGTEQQKDRLLGLTGKYFGLRRDGVEVIAHCILADRDEYGDLWLRARLLTSYGGYPEGMEYYFLPLGVPSIVRELSIEEATLWILAK